MFSLPSSSSKAQRTNSNGFLKIATSLALGTLSHPQRSGLTIKLLLLGSRRSLFLKQYLRKKGKRGCLLLTVTAVTQRMTLCLSVFIMEYMFSGFLHTPLMSHSLLMWLSLGQLRMHTEGHYPGSILTMIHHYEVRYPS